MVELENYECDGCRNDRGCGECPHNNERRNEYKRKLREENQSYRPYGYGINISD